MGDGYGYGNYPRKKKTLYFIKKLLTSYRKCYRLRVYKKGGNKMKDETVYEERAERFEEGKTRLITGETQEEALSNLLDEVKKKSKTFNNEERN